MRESLSLAATGFCASPGTNLPTQDYSDGSRAGGGSADATYTLKVLNDLFRLSLSVSQLENYAARLGSDCPFFIQDQPQMAHGTGTTLKGIHLDLSEKHIVLVYPNLAVATADAYGSIVPQEPGTPLKEILETTLPRDWKGQVVNDFEKSVFAKHPILADIKEEIYRAGAFYASMSGSGSVLYGLFEQPISPPTAWKGYTVWQGDL